MKGKKIVIILIIINILTIGIIYNFIKKDYLNNEKIIVKAMTEGEYEDNITALNQSHTDYANYIQESKIKIATALTDMGVPTSNEETLETMASNIRSLTGVSSADLLLTFSISNPLYLTEHFYTDIVEDISDGWKILTNGSIRFLGYAKLAADGGSAGSITIKINDVEKYSLSVDSTSQMQIDVTLYINYGDAVEIYCVGSSINGQYYGNRVISGKLHMIFD